MFHTGVPDIPPANLLRNTTVMVTAKNRHIYGHLLGYFVQRMCLHLTKLILLCIIVSNFASIASLYKAGVHRG
jgi:hypothetical protein